MTQSRTSSFSRGYRIRSRPRSSATLPLSAAAGLSSTRRSRSATASCPMRPAYFRTVRSLTSPGCACRAATTLIHQTTCYGCPTQPPTPRTPVPPPAAPSAGAALRFRLPSNCSTAYFDPIGCVERAPGLADRLSGKCTCSGSACAFADQSRPIGALLCRCKADIVRPERPGHPAQRRHRRGHFRRTPSADPIPGLWLGQPRRALASRSRRRASRLRPLIALRTRTLHLPHVNSSPLHLHTAPCPSSAVQSV